MYTIETAAAQILAYPPRSDVASRCQAVPCARCHLPILCPQDRSRLYSYAVHTVHVENESVLWEQVPYHLAGATVTWWRLGEEDIFIWLPKEQ